MTAALVTCGGGFQGLSLIKSLRAVPGIRVIVADWHEENVSRYFAAGFHRTPPLNDEPAFVRFLVELCRSEQIDAVFPSTSLELAVLARHRQALEATGAFLYVCKEPLLKIAADKWALHQWLSRHGLPSLPTVLSPHNGALCPPLVGKTRAGYGGRGHLIVRDAAELTALREADAAGRVWQPLLLDFSEYSIDFSIDRHGSVSPLAVRRRIRTVGGYAVLCEPTRDPGVLRLAKQVVDRLSALGAIGVLNLQILSADGQSWVSDLNPRAGTSMPLSVAAGRNPVAFLFGVDTDATAAANPPHRTLRTLEERSIAGPLSPSPAGVVFDLDDTLLDQKDWILRKLELTWAAASDVLPARAQFLDEALQIVEEGNRSRLFDEFCARRNIGDDLRHRLIDIYRQTRPDDCRLYPDVLPVLDQLRRNGLRLGLLTDNPAQSQHMKLDVTALRPYFDAIVLTDEIGVCKPDRSAFARVAANLGLAPAQLVMVGDHLWRDIRGALAAGLAHAFFVRREGAFYNFSAPLAARCTPLDNVTVIQDLYEIMWQLGTPHAVSEFGATPCQ